MPRKHELPDPAYLRSRLDYDADTGALVWRHNPTASASWNTRWTGEDAFTAVTDGYRTGRLDGTQHLAHRLVWAWHYGEWPVEQIDHINGDRGDNRIENLRQVSNTENARNASVSRNNTSGVTGVWWDKRRNRWRAEIKVDRQKMVLGAFACISDAVAARKAAEQRFGFHENHGKTNRRTQA